VALVDLPGTPGPYLAVMAIGFGVGAFGHLVHSPWLIAIGIATVIAALVLFQVFTGQHSGSTLPGF
jgi:hypothetical protein